MDIVLQRANANKLMFRFLREAVAEYEARLACGELQPLARSGAPAGEAAFLTEEMTRPQLDSLLSGVKVGSVFRLL